MKMFEAPVKDNTPKGWVCPKCGKVNSPEVKSCSCSKPKLDESQNTKRNWMND